MAAVAELQTCAIGIEACTGAFYRQLQFEELGPSVRVVTPQYVKPFVKHQKKDRNDAEAINTALLQPNMKFVPRKTEEQQDIQALHRARRRLVNHRTALVCQMRGLLLDRGAPIALTIGKARRSTPEVLEDQTNGLTTLTHEIIGDLFELMLHLDERIRAFDRRIDRVFRAKADWQRIAQVCGVGSKQPQQW